MENNNKNSTPEINNDNSEQHLDLNNLEAINQVYEPDPWYVTLGYSVGGFFKKIGLWLLDLLLSILKALLGIFIGIYKGAVKFGKWIASFTKRQIEYFRESDAVGKVSYGVMGASFFKHGQYFKGVIYLLLEVAFIVFMVLSGGYNLYKLRTCGNVETQAAQPIIDENGDVTFGEPIIGDNSIKCMLLGIMTVLIIMAFIYLYFANVKSANNNCHTTYSLKYHKAYEKALDFATNEEKFINENLVVRSQKTVIDKKTGEEKVIPVVKSIGRNKIIKLLMKEKGMSYFEAIIASRLNVVKYGLGDNDGAIGELKNEYNNHCHEFDKYNCFYDNVDKYNTIIKACDNAENIAKIIKESPNKKTAVTELVGAYELTANQANIIYNLKFQEDASKANDLKTKTTEELNAYLDTYPEHLDTHLYSTKRELGRYLDEKFAPTILFIPTIACIIMVILPLFFTIFIAFTNFDGKHTYPNLFTWTGFENFNTVFAMGSGGTNRIANTIWTLLGWTLVWAFFATFLNYIFGMILALLINKKGIHGKAIFRTLFVLTIAIPSFISLTSMAKLLSKTGAVNTFLMDNFGTTVDFLSNQNITVAKITIIIINLWVGIPYTMLMTSGILMNIPEDLYESARIDGAGPATQFFKITLPYMIFVTGPYLITQFVGNINNFNVIYFLTGGITVSDKMYHAKETDLLITWLYSLTTGNDSQYNLASVLGLFIFVVCAFFSLIFYSKTSAVKNEEDFQ